MAFKMKGSPHKMGKIQGTSGHTSALKQKNLTREIERKEWEKPFDYTNYPQGHMADGTVVYRTPKGNYTSSGEIYKKSRATRQELPAPGEGERAEVDGPLPMKSPLEQKKIIEGIKKFGKKVKEFGDKYDTGEKVAKGVKKAVKKKVAEYKPKSETTVSTETKKGRTKYKGDPEMEHSRDKVKVTASTKTNKKKLFGGKKETTSSTSKTYNQDTYADGDNERWSGDTKRGVTTTTHSRNKRRGGGKKKVVTVDQSTGKKTITRYRKDGSVKSTKVKKGDYKTNTPTAEKKAIKEENKGK